MNQLNKNRLIGGSVLLFTGLLFAPTILTPEPSTLTNPTLSVHIDSDNPQTMPSQTVISQQPKKTPAQTETTAVMAQPPVQLESIGTLTAAKPVPVVLESTATLQTKSTEAKPVVGSWIRVGSFSSKPNAIQLAKQLKKDYSVKIEVTSVDGKNYQRVLIGPFTAKKQLQAIMKKMRAAGHSPSIQR